MRVSHGTVYLRGDRYYLNVTVDGRQVRRSLGRISEDAAQVELQKFRKSVGASDPMAPPPVKPWHAPKGSWRDWAHLVEVGAKTGGWLHRLFHGAAARAKSKSTRFDLTMSDAKAIALQSNGLCTVSGVQFSWEIPNGAATPPFAPSMDRAVPSLGYIRENCRLVCWAVNLGMCDWGQNIYVNLCRRVTIANPRIEVS